MTELIKAFVAAQGELREAQESQTLKVGNAYSSRYADYMDVVRATRPTLIKHGLAITHLLDGDRLATRLYHVSGDFIESATELVYDHSDIKKKGGAMTYLKRYQYCLILGLVTSDEDPDNESTQYKGTNGYMTHEQINALESEFVGYEEYLNELLTKKGLSYVGQLKKEYLQDVLSWIRGIKSRVKKN